MNLDYDTILKVAGDNLSLGLSVVLHAPFGRYLPHDRFVVETRQRMGWGSDVTPVVVHVKVEGEETRRRVESRGLVRDAWRLAHWDQFWGKAGDVRCDWIGAEHAYIDNTGSRPDVDGLVAELERLGG